MTYCVGLRLNKGIIFMSDTRTNAGVDNFSKTPKMFNWSIPGERSITLMTAGNLATTQSLVSLLEERSKAVEDRSPTILEEPSMFQVARLVGSTLKEVIVDTIDKDEQTASSKYKATVVLGGQIKGGPPTLFLIYPEGNFIEVTEETPFFQIGEAKYGKPILVRAYDPDMSFEDAVKLLIVSFDSTMKANLSVGMPVDLHVYENDKLETGLKKRIESNDELYQSIASGWGEALRTAFKSLPSYEL
jgi:putative proteasome-type protease